MLEISACSPECASTRLAKARCEASGGFISVEPPKAYLYLRGATHMCLERLDNIAVALVGVALELGASLASC